MLGLWLLEQAQLQPVTIGLMRKFTLTKLTGVHLSTRVMLLQTEQLLMELNPSLLLKLHLV